METGFRLALFAIIVATMSVGGYFRVKAAASGERISHRAEGYLFAFVLRMFGLGTWLSIFAWLVSPESVAWANVPLPVAVRFVGVAVGMWAPVLMYWTLSTLGKNLTDTVVTRTGATLVTQGPYRWVRHPFYLTAGLVLLSATLIAANGMIGLCSLLILMMLAIRTPKEERMLIERFGDEYRNYQSRTGRFFPRIG